MLQRICGGDVMAGYAGWDLHCIAASATAQEAPHSVVTLPHARIVFCTIA